MVDRTKDTFALQPERLAADTAYGYGEMLAWLDDRQISPHIPVFDRPTAPMAHSRTRTSASIL